MTRNYGMSKLRKYKLSRTKLCATSRALINDEIQNDRPCHD